ncbi:hypothetical protein ACIGFL_09270 [Pseudomonas sp. NPDC077649]|uniref:hypothetical protein n=1 Tax=Pseudomonas sp. NPDC077649 TaxID=3364423 RepID=UPI0037C798EB
MTVQLALFKGRGQIGNAAIRWWTGSIYSHCELVADGWCYSSSVMDGGVRRKQVGPGYQKISLGSNWDLVDLPWANATDVVRYFEQTDHHRYGWGSLVASQFLNLNRGTPRAQFCSEWCAAAVGLPSPSSYSPATLDSICRFAGGLLNESA